MHVIGMIIALLCGTVATTTTAMDHQARAALSQGSGSQSNQAEAAPVQTMRVYPDCSKTVVESCNQHH